VKVKYWNVFLSGIILTGFLFTGCEDNITNDEITEYAQVRFIHSAASEGYLDFTYYALDGSGFQPSVYDAVYGGQYGYYTFVPGTRTFKAYLSNTNIGVAEITSDITADHKYSVIAVDFEAAVDPNLLMVQDNSTNIDEGLSRIRFIHASADAPVFGINYSDTVSLVEELEPLEVSEYYDLIAGTYDFITFDAATDTTILDVDPVTLLSGNAYTMIFSGSTGEFPGPVFNAILYQETGL